MWDKLDLLFDSDAAILPFAFFLRIGKTVRKTFAAIEMLWRLDDNEAKEEYE